MVNAAIYYYYYRNRQQRKLVKTLIENNNIEDASSLLDSTISEHDSYYENVTNSEFTDADNKSIHHAKDHLDSFKNSNQETQKEATTRALDAF